MSSVGISDAWVCADADAVAVLDLALAWWQLSTIDVAGLRREALGETCPTAWRTAIKRHVVDVVTELEGISFASRSARESLEAVRVQAERVLGQPCLTRLSEDGQSIEIVSPVINEQEVRDG